ncbi:hypothetical protein ACLOJK_016567 [Asimina triloba]
MKTFCVASHLSLIGCGRRGEGQREAERRKMVLWVFGYGSLIWKAGFRYDDRLVGFIKGFRRVFYQGSTDHRGTPGYPGRTVTLHASPDDWGVAYRVSGEEDEQIALSVRLLTYLEVREKQYDDKAYADFFTDPNSTTPAVTGVLVYIASPDKNLNQNYLGPAPIEDMASQIVKAEGPSGPNRDYLFQLEKALLQFGNFEAFWLLPCNVVVLAYSSESRPRNGLHKQFGLGIFIAFAYDSLRNNSINEDICSAWPWMEVESPDECAAFAVAGKTLTRRVVIRTPSSVIRNNFDFLRAAIRRYSGTEKQKRKSPKDTHLCAFSHLPFRSARQVARVSCTQFPKGETREMVGHGHGIAHPLELVETVLEVADVAWSAIDHRRHAADERRCEALTNDENASLQIENQRLRAQLQENLVLLQSLAESPGLSKECPPDVRSSSMHSLVSPRFIYRSLLDDCRLVVLLLPSPIGNFCILLASVNSPALLYSQLAATVDSSNFLTKLKSLQEASSVTPENNFVFKEVTGPDLQLVETLVNVDPEEPSWWVWVTDEMVPLSKEERSAIDNENYVIITEEHVIEGVADFIAICILANPKSKGKFLSWLYRHRAIVKVAAKGIGATGKAVMKSPDNVFPSVVFPAINYVGVLLACRSYGHHALLKAALEGMLASGDSDTEAIDSLNTDGGDEHHVMNFQIKGHLPSCTCSGEFVHVQVDKYLSSPDIGEKRLLCTAQLDDA